MVPCSWWEQSGDHQHATGQTINITHPDELAAGRASVTSNRRGPARRLPAVASGAPRHSGSVARTAVGQPQHRSLTQITSLNSLMIDWSLIELIWYVDLMNLWGYYLRNRHWARIFLTTAKQYTIFWESGNGRTDRGRRRISAPRRFSQIVGEPRRIVPWNLACLFLHSCYTLCAIS